MSEDMEEVTARLFLTLTEDLKPYVPRSLTAGAKVAGLTLIFGSRSSLIMVQINSSGLR